jgi:hypothetical protein
MIIRHQQSRLVSLIEAGVNVLVGYAIALVTQQMVFPLFGITATLATHSKIAAAFTGVSLVRSYLLRRLFEWRVGIS